jgi:hypothetical protein
VAHRVEHCPTASLRMVNKAREAPKHGAKTGVTMSTPALCTAHHTSLVNVPKWRRCTVGNVTTQPLHNVHRNRTIGPSAAFLECFIASVLTAFFLRRQCYLTIRQKPYHVLKQIALWNRLHLGRKYFLSLSRNSQHFMQPEGLLSYL